MEKIVGVISCYDRILIQAALVLILQPAAILSS
jgi:hypothetical protein